MFSTTPTWQPLNPRAATSAEKLEVEAGQPDHRHRDVLERERQRRARRDGKAAKVPKGAAVSKKKKFTIPPVTVQVPEDTPTAALKISKKGKKALKKAAKAGKKGKATVTATLTDELDQSATDTFKVTFKAKKK